MSLHREANLSRYTITDERMNEHHLRDLMCLANKFGLEGRKLEDSHIFIQNLGEGGKHKTLVVTVQHPEKPQEVESRPEEKPESQG